MLHEHLRRLAERLSGNDIVAGGRIVPAHVVGCDVVPAGACVVELVDAAYRITITIRATAASNAEDRTTESSGKGVMGSP